jgi:uncharacterized protein with GYD domain
MRFIFLAKLKFKPTKKSLATLLARRKKLEKKLGIKNVNVFYTLGRYDAVAFAEGPNEKAALKFSIEISDAVDAETLVAIPRDQVVKMLD